MSRFIFGGVAAVLICWSGGAFAGDPGPSTAAEALAEGIYESLGGDPRDLSFDRGQERGYDDGYRDGWLDGYISGSGGTPGPVRVNVKERRSGSWMLFNPNDYNFAD